ncbi:unnamed protein product [Camellia sinensis]
MVVRMAASGTAEIQQVGKTSKTYSIKGKEIASRKGKTRPPLNFLSILNNAKKTIDTSCPDKLCENLYAGVFLKENELKYFIDKKMNKNCFMLFARKLNICWIDDSRYWKWTKEETSGEEIEMEELKKVRTMYEIVFVVRMIGGDDL